MELLTANDLAMARGVVVDSLPGSAVVSARTVTDNAGGGGSVGYTAAGTFACRIAALTGVETEMGERMSEDSTWIITLPFDAVVDLDSQLEVSGTDHDGIFEVFAQRAWTQSMSRRLECREVT